MLLAYTSPSYNNNFNLKRILCFLKTWACIQAENWNMKNLRNPFFVAEHSRGWWSHMSSHLGQCPELEDYTYWLWSKPYYRLSANEVILKICWCWYWHVSSRLLPLFRMFTIQRVRELSWIAKQANIEIWLCHLYPNNHCCLCKSSFFKVYLSKSLKS